MRLLICSDGLDAADKPVRLGALIAGPCQAQVSLLGIAEKAEAEEQLREALGTEVKLLEQVGAAAEIIVRSGEPIHEILQQTTAEKYDLVVIGARIKRRRGAYLRSQRTYELIKSIPAPVLVAFGECERLTNFLLCTGGQRHSDAAVALTGEIAACAGAAVTLLHVMVEPPALFADLARREEDAEALLESGAELGVNLRAQKENLAQLGVPAVVRLRHGDVVRQIFAEQRAGGHEIIVLGSSRAHGALQHYIMGDVPRDILHRADGPVLIARSDGPSGGGWWARLKRLVSASFAS